ncbi:MAG: DUF1805 domain-containing protein [Methanobacteriota archaeon]
MIETHELELEGKKLSCLKVSLPKAPLIFILAPKGYIMCGYLNLDTAEKLDQAAAIVSGVTNFDDILNGKVSAVSSQARKLGITEGILGRDAIKKMI